MSNQGPTNPVVGIRLPNTPKKAKQALVLRPKTQRKEPTEDVLKEEQEKQLLYGKPKKPDKLQMLLSKIFNEKEWEMVGISKHHFIYRHRDHKEHVIEIHKHKEEIKFSGNPIEKVIDLANGYEHEFGPMDYEIEASNLKTAINFLKSLNEHGFEIDKINNLKIKEKESYDLKDIIADIKKNYPAPPLKRGGY